MASGYGLSGNVGRCYGAWGDFSTCMTKAEDPSECVKLREDYMECLHHRKEVGAGPRQCWPREMWVFSPFLLTTFSLRGVFVGGVVARRGSLLPGYLSWRRSRRTLFPAQREQPSALLEAGPLSLSFRRAAGIALRAGDPHFCAFS